MKKNLAKMLTMVIVASTLFVGCEQAPEEASWEAREQRIKEYNQTVNEVVVPNEEVLQFLETQSSYLYNRSSYDKDAFIVQHTEGSRYGYGEDETFTQREMFIQAIDEYFGGGVLSFIEENAQISETEISFKNKQFGDVIVTVSTQKMIGVEEIPYVEFNFLVKELNPNQTFYKGIADQMQTEDFVMSYFSFGEEKEMLEIANLAYVSEGTWVDYRVEGIAYHMAPKVSYRVYTDGEDVEKVRVIINKQKGLDLEEKALAPFYEALTLLGVENGKQVVEDTFIQRIDGDQLGTEKGNVGDLHYQYRARKEVEYMNSNTMIEIVLW